MLFLAEEIDSSVGRSKIQFNKSHEDEDKMVTPASVIDELLLISLRRSLVHSRTLAATTLLEFTFLQIHMSA